MEVSSMKLPERLLTAEESCRLHHQDMAIAAPLPARNLGADVTPTERVRLSLGPTTLNNALQTLSLEDRRCASGLEEREPGTPSILMFLVKFFRLHAHFVLAWKLSVTR